MSLFDIFKSKSKKSQDTVGANPQPIVPEYVPEVPTSPSSEGPSEGPSENLPPQVGTAEYFMSNLMRDDTESSEAAMVKERLLNNALDTIHEHLEKISEAEQFLEAKMNSENIPLASDTPADTENIPESSDDEITPDLEVINSDAIVKVFSSTDNMVGYLYLLAPIGEGAGPDETMLKQALSDAGIEYGIEEDTLFALVEAPSYYQLYVIAHGTPPVTGDDGNIIDHFPRTQEIRLEENKHGSIDYKDLHLFNRIEAGEIICDLIYPTDGTDGHNILGHTLRAAKGKMPPIPKGKNTSITEDGSALVSDIGGEISFQNHVFRVEAQLTIPGNVDNSTGNIEFFGDVIVEGDVRNGFEITAGGSITIYGVAENAILTAEENIEIKKGMNGNGKSVITAGGTVRSHFLEQTTVHAEGDVISETLINCHITSGGSILVSSGKGIVIGGMLAARYHIEAKRIGNLSDIHTTIKIGYFIKKEENLDTIHKDLKKAEDTLDKITKNCNYLSRLPEIPENRKELYQTLIEQKALYENMVSDLQEKLDQAEHREIDYRKCYVQGDTIYGITEISMNDLKYLVKDTTHKCKVYYSSSQGDLVLGTF